MLKTKQNMILKELKQTVTSLATKKLTLRAKICHFVSSLVTLTKIHALNLKKKLYNTYL